MQKHVETKYSTYFEFSSRCHIFIEFHALPRHVKIEIKLLRWWKTNQNFTMNLEKSAIELIRVKFSILSKFWVKFWNLSSFHLSFATLKGWKEWKIQLKITHSHARMLDEKMSPRRSSLTLKNFHPIFKCQTQKKARPSKSFSFCHTIYELFFMANGWTWRFFNLICFYYKLVITSIVDSRRVRVSLSQSDELRKSFKEEAQTQIELKMVKYTAKQNEGNESSRKGKCGWERGNLGTCESSRNFTCRVKYCDVFSYFLPALGLIPFFRLRRPSHFPLFCWCFCWFSLETLANDLVRLLNSRTDKILLNRLVILRKLKIPSLDKFRGGSMKNWTYILAPLNLLWQRAITFRYFQFR